MSMLRLVIWQGLHRVSLAECGLEYGLETDTILAWPDYWYTAEDFGTLAKEVADEMETIGNTWKFRVVTAQK
jgi:hypothetical protein